MRRALYEAAGVMLTRFKGKDKLKAWGLMLAKRGCHRKATVAVAAKMAVVMHACGATAPSMSAIQRRARLTSLRARLSNIASFWARTCDAATRWDFVDDHAKRARLLSKGAPRKRMRTGADQGRREARYLMEWPAPPRRGVARRTEIWRMRQ